jgi:pimeloyl-ACP methyl ester carboxylesterase
MNDERSASELRFVISGQGTRVLFVHGVGSHLESWNGVIAGMRDGFECLRYDLRGHGESPKSAGPYSLEMFASDLEAVALGSRWDDFHLVGFSLGGLIAQRFALDHPERVRTLSLISTVAGRTDEEIVQAKKRLATLQQYGASTHVATAAKRWFSDDFRRQHPDVVQARMAQSLANDPACYAEAYRVLVESDLSNELHKIRLPTLIMTGEEDTGSTPRMTQLMAASIPGSRAVVLTALRHSLLLEAPETIASELVAFINEHKGDT